MKPAASTIAILDDVGNTKMKLIVQIPCYNEEDTLGQTLADIPREIDGIDVVEVLVIDDGSTDRTVEVARELGVDHIVRNRCNQGLARTFAIGLDACLKAGADIIVNTDGDNQYAGKDIPKLIAPILEGTAEVVVGDRQTRTLAHFSATKRLLQRLGSHVVRVLAGPDIPDAVSGFRAISREAALELNIISPFSYTIEMLIQAAKKKMAIVSVPIAVNPATRKPRLYSSVLQFVERSIVTMIRMYAMYQPLRYFFYIGTVLLVIGVLPIIRFLYFYYTEGGAGHLQSLVLGGVLVMMGFLSYLVGLVADLTSFNRRLIEITLEKVRRLELEHHPAAASAGEERDPKRE